MKASPRVFLCLLLATVSLIPLSSSALVMREHGPEPVILEIKESLRKSDSLDADLASLAQVQRLHGLTVERRWAGVKYLERVASRPISPVNVRWR